MTVQRTSFYDERARRRSNARAWGALTLLAGLVAATPVAILVAPFAFLLLVLMARLLSFFTAIPDSVVGFLGRIGQLLPELIDRGPVSTFPIFAAALAPGLLLLVGLALAFRRRFRQDGIGAVLLELRARQPSPDDLEERQLVNLVEEMALAAEAPVPATAILDLEARRAAMVGSKAEDAPLHRPTDRWRTPRCR